MKIDLANFDIPNIESWKAQVQRETNKDEAIIYENTIEKIQIDLSNKNSNCDFQTVNDSLTDNEWDIAVSFIVNESFADNKSILKCLEQGANHIYLNISINKPNWNRIFENIIFEYVHVTIAFETELQIQSFRDFLLKQNEKNFTISIDPFCFTFVELFKDTEVSYSLNAFGLEQIGANTHQQLASLLSAGEQMLQQLINPKKIKFEIGIGSDFFIEISKIRALKWLWKHLLTENDFEYNEIQIMGRSGWSNKSTRDPHTNLLRQTTEGLSSLCGGVSCLLLHATSELSKDSSTWFDQRMALNISHILREESFLSKVNDPLKGSHVTELLSKEIILNSWSLFLKLIEAEKDKVDFIVQEVEKTRKQKIDAYVQGEKKLLGINLFSINNNELEWCNIPDYLEMEYLIYEKLNTQ